MGLDMYLERTPKDAVEEVGYWRKANQVLRWIDTHVAPVENCERIKLSLDNIRELRDDCQKVIDGSELVEGKVKTGVNYVDGKPIPHYTDCLVIANPELAEKIMPIEDGFFYGSTDYNEWYINQLKDTVKICEEILDNPKSEDYDFNFIAWW